MDRACESNRRKKEDLVQGRYERSEEDLQTKGEESTSKGKETPSKEGKDGDGKVRKHKPYTPEFYQKNKERLDANNARWKAKNKEKMRLYIKQWRIDNPDKIKAHNEKKKDRYRKQKEEERVRKEREELIKKEEEKRRKKALRLGLREL